MFLATAMNDACFQISVESFCERFMKLQRYLMRNSSFLHIVLRYVDSLRRYTSFDQKVSEIFICFKKYLFYNIDCSLQSNSDRALHICASIFSNPRNISERHFLMFVKRQIIIIKKGIIKKKNTFDVAFGFFNNFAFLSFMNAKHCCSFVTFFVFERI